MRTPYHFPFRKLYSQNGFRFFKGGEWTLKILGYDLWWGWRSGDNEPHYKYGLHFAYKGKEETSCEKKGYSCLTLFKHAN